MRWPLLAALALSACAESTEVTPWIERRIPEASVGAAIETFERLMLAAPPSGDEDVEDNINAMWRKVWEVYAEPHKGVRWRWSSGDGQHKSTFVWKGHELYLELAPAAEFSR